MEELIKEIMERNFDTERLEEELEEIISCTMDEYYHQIAHKILSNFDPIQIFFEVIENYFDIPF